ncbi:MAG: flagellar biosynthetic protein FliO [Gammaproteobacteria bacterium]|nr:flagellar biosynthetic protein FliO [Gammaproteobacteria bacterium]
MIRKFIIAVVLIMPLFYMQAGLAVEDDNNKTEVASVAELSDSWAKTNLSKLGTGLFAILALIIALAWIMRRVGYMQSATGDKLKVISALSVGSREKLVLIQVGSTQLLIGVAPGQIQKIHLLDENIPLKSVGTEFSEKLQRVISKSKSS